MTPDGLAPGVSALLYRLGATAWNVPLATRMQILDASDIIEVERKGAFAAGQFTGTFLRPMLIVNLGDRDERATVRQFLARHVPAAHRITLFETDTTAPEHACTVADLETGNRDITAIRVPAVDEIAAGSDPRRIQRIVSRLRLPDGCPWDRAQTHQSLRDAIIDEAYEVTDAIDSGDSGNLEEELGDLLLLITMHAQIAAETGAFTIEDVQESIATKIVGRHPHVFDNDVVETEADLARVWNEAKTRERAAGPDKGGVKDVDGEPRSMPALTRASRVLRKQPLAVSKGPSTPEQRADRLLQAVAEIIEADDDPEAVLRAALIRHTTADHDSKPPPFSASDEPEPTSGK